jgi:hypothetical protein
MKTFRQYIQEASVIPIKSTQLDLQEVEEIIKKNCSDSLWMFKRRRTIWRGENDLNSILGKDGVAIIDITKSERKSQNTSNWYTLIIDNSPKYKDFPKRSQSLICSSNIEIAKAFGPPMAIIPFNSAKIGVVNTPDMWNKSVIIGGKKMDVEVANKVFNPLKKFGLSDTNWQSFIDFDKKLKTDKKFREEVEDDAESKPLKSLFDDFVVKIRGLYDNLGFELLTPKQYEERTKKRRRETEMWIGGKVVALSKEVFETIL